MSVCRWQAWLTFGAFGPSTARKYSNFFYFGQIFQLYLLDQQNIHFHHHIHCLQQIFREVTFFKEKRIEAMMHVVLKMI